MISNTATNIQLVDDLDDNPFHCSEYVEDIFRCMQESEVTEYYSIPGDFLDFQLTVNGYHRAVLIDWLIQVHMKFKLLQDTLHIAVDIVDRYLKVIIILHVHVL